MKLDSLNDLYFEHIQDLYSAEQQIIKALPKLIDKACSQQLAEGFSKHLGQTREHARRLEGIATRAGKKADGMTCKGMKGILEEGAEVLDMDGDERVIDAALISAAQRVEHYEMAGYGCARAYALALGLVQDAEALQHTLNEERETDETLTQLAESVINPGAKESSRAISVEREPDASARPRSTITETQRDTDARL